MTNEERSDETLCACNCGAPAQGKSRYASDACRTRHRKERTGYGSDVRRNGRNGAFWEKLGAIQHRPTRRRAA